MAVDKAAYMRGWRQRNHAKSLVIHRRANLKKSYGISIEEYDSMLAAQASVCAICSKNPDKMRLGVDHCHKTGRIRGLLCTNCNQALGKFKDSPALMLSAIQYIQRSL